MTIEHYSFGEMIIDGKTYNSDLIIFPDRVDHSWRRKQGHLLQKEDLGAVLSLQPKILIIGTGFAGIMKVPQRLREEIISLGIDLHVEKSGKAVALFNKLSDPQAAEQIIIACFHLTC